VHYLKKFVGKRIKVRMASGREYEGEVVQCDGCFVLKQDSGEYYLLQRELVESMECRPEDFE
jgi:hypothetical protein